MSTTTWFRALALLALLITAAPRPASALPTAVRCADFGSQAAAQAAYRANPQANASLDGDKDGIACERNPAPYDRSPVCWAATAHLAACRSAAAPPAQAPAPASPPAPVPAPAPAAPPAPPDGLAPALVVRVVDGDTVDVQFEDGSTARVRLIGVDTPETVDPRRPVQCYGEEASARTRELVDGQPVWLEKDVSETDRYGRLLRYVWLQQPDGSLAMLNAVLLSEGYAQVATYPPDVRYVEWFLQLQREARDNARGLWGACGG